MSLCLSVNTAALGTSAKAAILINADTGEVIYEHNADLELPMASTTKIMTGLLLCENGDLEREITVTAEMLRVEGSSMGLLAGDRVTLHDLLYGLMLASGNDAANVIAYTLGGTVNGFAKIMNNKAVELGLKNTNFVTPSGLDAEGHYTTARDLASLTRYALQNETFKGAVSAKSAILNYGNPPYRRTLTNHNKLLKTYQYAIGVKTGFTKKSGRCLVSAAERDGKCVVAVTLNDGNDWADHEALLEYGLSAVKTIEISPECESFEIPIISGKQNSLTVSVKPYSVSCVEGDGFSCEINLPQFVYAPVSVGETVGSAVYKQNGKIIAKIPVCAETQVATSPQKKGFYDSVKENIKYIFYNMWEK